SAEFHTPKSTDARFASPEPMTQTRHSPLPVNPHDKNRTKPRAPVRKQTPPERYANRSIPYAATAAQNTEVNRSG
ncbi:hypothetical protein LTR60_006713, partial [Cryomyces antarcticus]